jgi:phage repressor protein C with HTH and peptisase S24 domain
MIPRPVAHKTIFDGDVVAFESPLSTSVMVRRIAALEGDVMVTSDDPTPDDEEFTIPQVR